jgi:hypothetical protein
MHHANASITRYAIRWWFLLGSKLSVTTSFRSVCTCLLDRSGSGCWSYASTPRPQTCNSNKREPNHPPFWATPERTRVGGGSNGRVAVERRMRGVQPCTSLYSARTRSAWLSLHKVGITKVGITPKKLNSLLLPGQQTSKPTSRTAVQFICNIHTSPQITRSVLLPLAPRPAIDYTHSSTWRVRAPGGARGVSLCHSCCCCDVCGTLHVNSLFLVRGRSWQR